MKNSTYDRKLEGLRGLCAVVVATTHLIIYNFFGASALPLAEFFFHFQFAHCAVLLFFIISGYVMGLSHFGTTFNRFNVWEYIKRRLVRLYPIYLTALLVSVIFGGRLISVPQFIGHLFFLQEFFVPTLVSNVVLWSLSYEIAYYILFIGLWSVNKLTIKSYFVLFAFIITFTLIGHSNTSIKSLLIGWTFWLAGLYISRLADERGADVVLLQPLISRFFILIATFDLQSGGAIMRLLHISFNNKMEVNFEDLVFLPICTLIVTGVTGRHRRNSTWLEVTAYIIPAFNLFLLIYFKHDILANKGWTYGIIFFCLGLLFLKIKNNADRFGYLSYVGKISYAVYVFHFPIAFFLNKCLSSYLAGSALFFTGICSWAVLTIVLAVLTETVIQPRIKKLLLKRKALAITGFVNI